ncbi:SDR family oxidoreductase [Novosphingobium sp.]|uniref:SDR family NAD(P)-dependent oxidoreductase n=1 Tax=Novosphingobium sp. TaxID=1874826 RepID=UPI0025FD9F1E|nr:SDR family oxidoreductase [Novosphingobium sp.]MCC6924689.1 SDR family oxidoreductase [Novosphingobium sp.]
MSGRLAGRRALITGAADGIGLGIARLFAREGADVVLADWNGEKAEAEAAAIRAAGGQARALQVDVMDKAAVLAMMEAAGPVDVLVNNAYTGDGPRRLESKGDEIFDRAMLMAFWAPKWTMEAALPHMKAQRWGRVINMGSLNGVNAHMGSADYNSAKEAMRALTRTAAREWAGWGICCNVICPAAKSAASRRIEDVAPEMMARIEAANPMGRMGDPESDIAPVALFLASEDCRYVTGNTLFADGGGHINGVAWAPDLGD